MREEPTSPRYAGLISSTNLRNSPLDDLGEECFLHRCRSAIHCGCVSRRWPTQDIARHFTPPLPRETLSDLTNQAVQIGWYWPAARRPGSPSPCASVDENDECVQWPPSR